MSKSICRWTLSLCDIANKGLLDLSFLLVTGVKYLMMLQNWLLPQKNEDSKDFILQQDEAPSHWQRNIQSSLNVSLPQQWIGRTGNKHLALQFSLLRSPDVTPCDFSFGGS